MSSHKKRGFYVGQTESGEFVAASVSAPYFFFFGDSEAMVTEKAQRAFVFHDSADGEHFDMPKSSERRVLSFVPQRRVEVCLEAA